MVRGAVIGASSVVTCDVAPHTLVAGVPARVLRKPSAPRGGDCGAVWGAGRLETEVVRAFTGAERNPIICRCRATQNQMILQGNIERLPGGN